ncbi:MAG TPA: hypothetical protein VHV09_13095 [Trebonia sp.]|jgi:hypothetical protein|nr:hypothetical protein [Trebonia sp.]
MSEGAGQADGRPDGQQGGEPAAADAALLDEMRALRRRARSARHAYWFPLALFGLLTCASVPFYIQPGIAAGGGVVAGASGQQVFPVLGGAPGLLTQPDLGYYWLAALLAGLLATLLWYRWNARRVGLATPARGYVITVAALTAVAVAVPLVSTLPGPDWLHGLQFLWPGDLTIRGTFPFVIIAVGLWVLAWAERSPALAVIAAVYTATAVLASLYDVENVLFRLGWNPAPGEWDLTSLPNVLLPALVLLAAAAGAFAAQRRRRPPAPAGSASGPAAGPGAGPAAGAAAAPQP